jgi:hypothetical protein
MAGVMSKDELIALLKYSFPFERIIVKSNIGINTTAPTSKLHVVGLPVYANNAAALAGGLTAGAFYRTNGDPDAVCVVH